jgi:hypothetical protein
MLAHPTLVPATRHLFPAIRHLFPAIRHLFPAIRHLFPAICDTYPRPVRHLSGFKRRASENTGAQASSGVAGPRIPRGRCALPLSNHASRRAPTRLRTLHRKLHGPGTIAAHPVRGRSPVSRPCRSTPVVDPRVGTDFGWTRVTSTPARSVARRGCITNVQPARTSQPHSTKLPTHALADRTARDKCRIVQNKCRIAGNKCRMGGERPDEKWCRSCKYQQTGQRFGAACG